MSSIYIVPALKQYLALKEKEQKWRGRSSTDIGEEIFQDPTI